jgi:hypothetical protein
MKLYIERLRLIGLTTLEKRRTWGDLIETFKIMTGREGIYRDKFFHLACSGCNTRGHSMKLSKPRVNATRCINAFSIRVVVWWTTETNCLRKWLMPLALTASRIGSTITGAAQPLWLFIDKYK